MAIEKNNFKVSRFDSEFSPRSRETLSSDDDELQHPSSGVESDDDDEFDDADSGAGSDDFDLLELGETGAEFCQIGNQTCSIPLELYDLPGLEDVLSVDVWNECLSEEERFDLSKYLPDMDQETVVQTLKDLFTGCNFHFGSPIRKLFDMLKGGLCEPRVALYREGLTFFQKRQHYHLLRKHQNNMVSNLCQMRDAWLNRRGYSIEEKLRLFNIMKSQKSSMNEKMEDLETDSSDKESVEGLWRRKKKDRKIPQKMAHHLIHGLGLSSEFPPHGQHMYMEPESCSKQNPRGILKLPGLNRPSAMDFGGISSVYHGLDVNSGIDGPAASLTRQSKALAHDSLAMLNMTDDIRAREDAEEKTYEMGIQRDRNLLRGNLIENSGGFKMGKKHNGFRGDRNAFDHFIGHPLSSKVDLQAYARNSNQSSDVKMSSAKPSSVRAAYDLPKKAKYLENVQQFVIGDQMKPLKRRGLPLPLKGSFVNSTELPDMFRHNKNQEEEEEEFDMDSSFKYDGWNMRSKKWKTGRESSDHNYKSYRSSLSQVSDRFLPSDFRGTPLQEKIRGSFVQNGVTDVAALKSNRMLLNIEDTESDSSEQSDHQEHGNPFMRSKSDYPSSRMEGSHSPVLKSHLDLKKQKIVKKGKKENGQVVDGKTHSKKMVDFGEQGCMPDVEKYPLKPKQKGKMRNGGFLLNSSNRALEESYTLLSNKLNACDDERREMSKFGKKGRLPGEHVESSHLSSLKIHNSKRKKKGKSGLNHSIPKSHFLHNIAADEEGGFLETNLLVDDIEGGQGRLGNRRQDYDAYSNDCLGGSDAPLLGCNSATKRRRRKEELAGIGGRVKDSDLQSSFPQPMEESTPLRRKEKRKSEAEPGTSDVEPSEPIITETENIDILQEPQPQKRTFTLITPTVHTGFSFSIIHLLSAVRMAMITPLPEYNLDVDKNMLEQNGKHEDGVSGAPSNENMAAINEHNNGQMNMPSLTIQEIVDRVRSNPGDPCILETQEPLQDLVRGVLKTFSSKTAPLGAKGWKALVVYEKSTRSWSWVGSVSRNSSDHDTTEEVTCPEVWGLPYKMLVKLVDCFANWLRSGQDTLQQIGSLPEPPLELMEFNIDEKERFRDLRAQKSLITIRPSSEAVKSYFRREEILRYSIPDRAFSYTAADGKKSIVAPLRRCGGKPTSKARDHFMLKRDRPPHVTILCLVRDAAARLPGSIGTRADVCTLIRDSQYIVEDVSDAQINQVVSGALDRLHYERDPCVQYDSDRKLWVYLHREREEEDFEDDGTSSTKKWKRQKKDAPDQSEQGTVTVAYPGTGEQSGYDLCSDLNAEPLGADNDKEMEFVSEDVRLNVEDSIDANQETEQGNIAQGNPLVWDTLSLNPMQEDKVLCQQNSTNEDFDDETFGSGRPVKILSASLL